MLQSKYKEELQEHFGITFNSLFTMNNMPIKRFADLLHRQGKLVEYMQLLVDSFNPATIDGLMCRNLVSISHDGTMYDCDFNQALATPMMLPTTVGGAAIDQAGTHTNAAASIFDVQSLSALAGAGLRTSNHCFGCTAGAGST